LLPRWRGAAPIQQAILSGDAQTGVCLMRMEAGLDTGPVFASVETPIDDDDTAGSVHDRLCTMGGELLVSSIDDILAGRIVAVPQDNSAATYAGKIQRDDAAIEWKKDAHEIHRQVRAYNPVPGAYFELAGESIKCWQAAVIEGTDGEAGTVLQADKEGIVIACGSGALSLVELQRPGRNRVSGAEFAAQEKLAGKRFG
jgi:methionyl-tRNA formyltransferase